MAKSAKFDRDRAMAIIREGTEEEQRRLLDDIVYRLENKKYGLVWERGGDDEDSAFETENVVVECSSGIPYPIYRGDLSTFPERADGNLLLEGDNYVWLNLLEQTHRECFDIVYFDPPYGTGATNASSGFLYNDRFVKKDNVFKHSMWLDFIQKRLKLAYGLLALHGVVIISCDEHYQADLKLLCDEVFGEDNCVGVLPTIMNWKGNQSEFGFAGTHEYTIVYAKDKSSCVLNELPLTEEELQEWDKDEIGYYKQGAFLRATGIDAPRERRQWMFYPVLIKDGEVSVIDESEYAQIYDDTTKTFDDDYVRHLVSKYEQLGYEVLLPTIDNNQYGRWRWGYEKMKNDSHEVIVKKAKGSGSALYKKQRPTNGKIPTVKPKSVLYKPEYSSGNGSAQIEELLGRGAFNNPKPLSLMEDLLYIGGNENALVLDFFAGSGTTAHAIENLNLRDNGSRRWVLITSNEDQDEDDGNPETGICRDITKPRLDTIITGVRPDGSKYSDGLDSGYSYYQYGFLPRTIYKDKNARAFQRPVVLDPFVAIKYGAYKIATDEEAMAYIYRSKDAIIVLAFGQATKETIERILAGVEVDEDLPVIAIVSDGCPLDMEHQNDIEVVPFSKLTDNSYLGGRR